MQTTEPGVQQAQAGPEVDMQDVQLQTPLTSPAKEQKKGEEPRPSTPKATISKQEAK